ncbi:MAG: hypothetical protein NTY12_01785 [Candidatus Falkowbacteria bacterium]|nr:hypothetical protein [Candidatus Falkowbacteria bacterium]
MPINPNVKKNLEGSENEEFKSIILNIFRYDSPSGRQIADAVTYEKETGDAIGKNIEAFAGGIGDTQIVEYICDLCPEFAEILMNYSINIPEEDRTFGLLLDKFSEYIVNQYKVNKIEKFNEIFEMVELGLTHGNGNVNNMFRTNILENIQNVAGNQDIDPSVFIKYLGKNSLMWWNEINRFWGDLEKYYKLKYPNQLANEKL